MKYIYYSSLIFALLLGSCSQQKQITKAPGNQLNTIATQTPHEKVQVTATRYEDTNSIAPANYYQDAYGQLQQMLDGKEPINFKKAVFITENAWYQGKIPYDVFNRYISSLASVCRAWKKTNPIIHYHTYAWNTDTDEVNLNGAIYHILTDTVKDEKRNIVSIPFHYDFNDCFAKDNWTNSFVTKLMATHGGNCHSLPFLYKILAEELGTKAYLCMLPGHIYISQYSRKTSWYNTELTGRCFPVDAWLMSTGYVSVQSIRTRLYMDTLSLKESVAVCVNDLAKGYQRKFGDGNYTFILKCCNLGLKYYPTYGELLLLKAETLKKLYQAAVAKYGLNAPDSKEYGNMFHSIYNNMEETYNTLAKLDYREIPEALYSHWTEAMINGGKPENENIHDTVVYTDIGGKRQGTITVSYGNTPMLFNVDTLRRIGSVIFNRITHKVQYFILRDDDKYSVELTRPEEPARFLSVDPITKQFPELSPYQYAGNTPIWAKDLDGKEPAYYQNNSTLGMLIVPASDQLQRSVPTDATYLQKTVQPTPIPILDDILVTFQIAFTGYDDQGNKVDMAGRAAAMLSIVLMGAGGPEGEGMEGTGGGEEFGGGIKTGEVHGNSLKSEKLQHGYEIKDKQSGETYKYGISGKKLNKNGTSSRANSQVNKLNKDAGYEKYEAKIHKTGMKNRKESLKWEKNKVGDYYKLHGENPSGNQRPKTNSN